MSKQIKSQILGQLRQDDNFPDWWKSAAIEIPFLDNHQLTITFMDCEPEQDKAFIEEADDALTNFLNLAVHDRRLVSQLVYKNCIDMLDAVDLSEYGEPLRNLNNIDEIWKFIHPTEIFVTRRPYKEQDIYVVLACECDWEQEHGLQFVFRQGRRLTRISDQDGHITEADAYDKPDEEDELLSKFR